MLLSAQASIPMPKTFKAIGFDWAGVIAIFPGGALAHQLPEVIGVTRDEYLQAYFRHNHIINKGTIPFAEATEMWALVMKDLGKEEKLEAVLALLQKQAPAVVDQEVLRLVKFLKSLGFKMGLLSNASLDAAIGIRRTEVDQLFDASIFSAEINFMKPEPEAFHELARRLDVNLSDLIFIDDANRSLSTAPELGYEPILYRGMDGLLERLTELGVLSSEDVKRFREVA